jgi:monoamine oxidase
MAGYFGIEAMNPIFYEDHSWANETWSMGCYAGVYTPGLWTSHQGENFLKEENIFWAGTESSDRWYGYIEGAVLAGYNAADKVLSGK